MGSRRLWQCDCLPGAEKQLKMVHPALMEERRRGAMSLGVAVNGAVSCSWQWRDGWRGRLQSSRICFCAMRLRRCCRRLHSLVVLFFCYCRKAVLASDTSTRQRKMYLCWRLGTRQHISPFLLAQATGGRSNRQRRHVLTASKKNFQRSALWAYSRRSQRGALC